MSVQTSHTSTHISHPNNNTINTCLIHSLFIFIRPLRLLLSLSLLSLFLGRSHVAPFNLNFGLHFREFSNLVLSLLGPKSSEIRLVPKGGAQLTQFYDSPLWQEGTNRGFDTEKL